MTLQTILLILAALVLLCLGLGLLVALQTPMLDDDEC